MQLRTLSSLGELQRAFNDETNRNKTKQAIAELELKLGVCVDELLSEERDESFHNNSVLDDSEEMLTAELQCSDEGSVL